VKKRETTVGKFKRIFVQINNLIGDIGQNTVLEFLQSEPEIAKGSPTVSRPKD
jgi:hypothetical protein